MSWILFFSVVGVLLLFSAFFSAAETALFALNKMDREYINRNHKRMARLVNGHLNAPSRTLGALLIGNLTVNTLAAALVASQGLSLFGVQAMVWMTAAFSFVMIIFCEMLPKMLALKLKIILAVFTALPLRVAVFIFYPVDWMMRNLISRLFVSLMRDRRHQVESLSENELKTLIKIGEEEGVLDPSERERLHELFELGERPVREIMTPRTDLVGLDADDSLEKHTELIRKHHFSQMPVYQNSLDQVIGVMDVQFYLLSDDPRLRQQMKKTVFVPETKKINDLLADFRRDGENFAVCVDEYGGTAGVVTLEDILEEIFGEFEDEYSRQHHPIRSLNEEGYLVEAKISLDDFNEYFKSELDSASETTLGGYLLEKIGEVPTKGVRYEDEFFEYQIQDMARQRIRYVVVRAKK
ncbi:MAG TPA: hemolysin family protein [Candidatus Omnitrophota bacterium]|nr:hemolysin family protein [Candidatus Omnitrophota bacterium]